MQSSPVPNKETILNEVEQLSVTIRPEKDAKQVKELLQNEVEDGLDVVFAPTFHSSSSIGDVLLESANQRVIIAETHNLITPQQINALTSQLSRHGKIAESVGEVVSVSTLLSVLSTSPRTVRECFSAAVIQELISASNSGNGCISCQLVGDFLRTCCRRSQQRLLESSEQSLHTSSVQKQLAIAANDDTLLRLRDVLILHHRRCYRHYSGGSLDSGGIWGAFHIIPNKDNPHEFVDFVMSEISNKITWDDNMNNSPYYYAVFIERSVFLHLDPQRSLKISIKDLTSTRLIDDLFDVVYEQSRDNKDQSWDVSQLSWCALNNFYRVLAQFRRCDRDWSGMVSLEECRYLKEGAYTPLFLKRVFATQMLYGDDPKSREMDFRGFVELDVAVHTRKEPASIKWLFRALDLRDDGVLDRTEIKMMTESMVNNLATLEGWSNFVADDIADEVIDMIHPQDPNRITVDEVISSRMADTALGILIDYHAFLKYENREEEAAS